MLTTTNTGTSEIDDTDILMKQLKECNHQKYSKALNIIGAMYAQVKSLSTTPYALSSIRVSQKHASHCLDLKDKEWSSYEGSVEDLQYENR